MMKTIFKNKLLISFVIILTLLGTLLTNKILAEENENTVTVEAAEGDPNHKVGTEGKYIPFSNLRDYYDIFCCYHGGVDSVSPSSTQVMLNTEEGSVSEGYLTQNDVNVKQNFVTTLEGENTETPFKQGTYQHLTYGYYHVKSSEICTPKEAYILAEMLYNLVGNVEIHEPEDQGNISQWASYVQEAWWSTIAGGHGQSKVLPNDLALEAEAFEAYILEAAGVSTINELTHNTVLEYEYDGQTKTIDCGFDIKYEPKFNEDTNLDGVVEQEVGGADRPTVSWDDNDQVYKIGPFSIDYIEKSAKVGNREEVQFAGMYDAKIYTDAGEEPLERGKDWEFLWINAERDEEDDSEFPHQNEIFYIKMNYIEGASKITDLEFDFKYMNAAGKYEYLEGTYFTATWNAEEKDNWCYDGYYCRHGYAGPHTVTSGSASNPTTYTCSGGHACKHGKYTSHIASTTYWVQLKDLVEHKAQLFAYGVAAARVDKFTELHWNAELSKENKGSIRIEKKVVDLNGNPIDCNKKFDFNIYINGEYRETVTVKANNAITKSYTWHSDEATPTYRVEEVPSDGYKVISISNQTGNLAENNTISVEAINQDISIDHKGKLKIDKIVVGDTKDKEYHFDVMIGNDYYDAVVSEETGWSWTSPEYTWKDDNAPRFSVEEVNLPEGTKLISISQKTGYLVDEEQGSLVTVTAINETDSKPEYEYGKVRITKKLDGNASSSDTFDFKLTVDSEIGGHEEIFISLAAGNTYESGSFVWEKGKAAPTYKVEELNIPEGARLVEIKNGSGTLDSSKPVEVIAINELEEKSGKVSVTKNIVTDDKVQDEAINETFTINIKISGTFEMNGESIVNGSRTITKSIKAGESFETPEIKWYGDSAPTYTISETDIPAGWMLESISSQSGTLEDGKTKNITVLNSYTTIVIIDLTMELAGDVWEDAPLNEADKNTENSVVNGLYDREVETPINGVEVKIYRVVCRGNEVVKTEEAYGYLDEDKTPIEFPIITGENTEEGHWSAPRMPVPALTDEEKAAGCTKAKYDIEFTYDGQTYEPTKFLATKNGNPTVYLKGRDTDSTEYNPSADYRLRFQNDSMAQDTNREEVNNRIAEVKGKTPIDGATGKTIGTAVSTAGVENDIEYTSTDNPNPNINRKISEAVTLNENGIAKDLFKAKATTGIGGLLYPFDERYHLERIDKYIDELGRPIQKCLYSATYPYTQHINLGLQKRKTADMSSVKDLVSATVAVNGKLIEYKYNNLLDRLMATTDSSSISEVIANRETLYFQAKEEIEGYKLKLYGSDYYYRTEIYKSNEELYNDLNMYYQDIGLQGVGDREMDIFLKYRIDLYNDSLGGYDVEFNEVLDYYDESFELVTTEVKKFVQSPNDDVLEEQLVTVAKPSTYGEGIPVNWDTSDTTIYTDANGEQYKLMKTTTLDNVKVKAGEKVSIEVTFKLLKDIDSQNAQDSIRIEGIDALKSNIVEIANYSTYDSETGKIAGKLDKDSAPDNVNLNLQEDGDIEGWFEDDTAAAPELEIGLYDTTRDINGLAWEDKEDELVEGYNEYVGNGIFDEDENVLGGLDTELVEKITTRHYVGNTLQRDEAGNEIYKEYDFIWPTEEPLTKLGGKTVSDITGFTSKTTTANITAEGVNEGEYKFNNVPAGNFVVRFTFGNKEIVQTPSNEEIEVFNGHDFKTTTYQTGFNNSNEEGILNNEWHDLENEELAEKRVSDARDSEARRLEVIQKSRIITNANAEVLATANDKEANHDELFNEYYMYADTAKLNLEIENVNDKAIKELVTNNNVNQKIGGLSIKGDICGNEAILKYDINNIDVGLEERSENKIVLDKEISRIKLTTSAGDTILDAKYNIDYKLKNDSRTGETTWEAKLKLDDSSVGINQLQALDKDEVNGIQNFRYINVDESILQGTTLELEYTLTALNVSEVDLVGKKLEELETEEMTAEIEKLVKSTTEYTKLANGKFTRENNVGNYLGSTYYNGINNENNKDVPATVKVRQLIDYVDNDATFAVRNNMEKDHSWRTITEAELLGEKDTEGNYPNRMVSLKENVITINPDETIGEILDDKGNKYNTNNKSNIILSIDNDGPEAEYSNSGFMKKLIPYIKDNEEDTYMSQLKLVTTKYMAAESDSDNMNFDNIAEVVKFESSVGKRDINTIPGNAKPFEGEFKTSLEERDSSATELVTLTPPTGADTMKVISIQLIVVILAGLLIIATGIVIIKKKVLDK